MKEILEYIQTKKQEFAQSPFIQFLQDKSIHPRQRLAWAPCLTHFAMCFKDFNQLTLRKEPTTHRIQQMINQHTREDGRHWKWFLQDMKLLGFDNPYNFTDTLKFVWGEETKNVRLMTYNLFGMCSFEDDLLMKLVIIESIEVTGNVALYETGLVAEELKQITNQHYPYFAHSHYAVESGHIQADMDIDQIENFLQEIQLTKEQKEKAFILVDKVFSDFLIATNEMLDFAKKFNADKSFINTDFSDKKLSMV